MDQFLNSDYSSLWMLPWATFVAGLVGSLHCIGMCGALSSSCQKSHGDQLAYQSGRLLSYILLGIIAASFIGLIQKMGIKKELSLIPAFLIGLFLIINGFSLFRSSKERKAFSILSKLNSFFFSKVFRIQTHKIRSFLIGSMTLFLPCGLLYTVLAGVISFQHPFITVVSMLTFWLGTLPALYSSSWVFINLLKPLANYSRGLSSFILISLGLGTICYRLFMVYGGGHVICH